MMNIKRIRGSLQEMAKEDILDMVDFGRLQGIKARDANPLIRVYNVGHEGKSEGRLIGIGKKVKHWAKEAISKLMGAISTGVPIYKGHAKTNDTAGRVPIGEVVGKSLRVGDDGKDSALVAVWYYPDHKDEAAEYDSCSVECDVEFDVVDGDNVEISGVEPVSAIAVGSRADGEVPGFPEAGLVAQLQMFADKGGIQMSGAVTLEQVKEFITSNGTKVTDLYTTEAILNSDPVTEKIREEKKAEAGFGTRWKERATEAEKELEDLKKSTEKTVPKEEFDKVMKQLAIHEAKPVAKDVAKEMELTDKELAFLDLKLKDFAPESIEGDDLKEEAKKFVKGVQEEFAVTAKALGLGSGASDGGSEGNETPPIPAAGGDRQPTGEPQIPESQDPEKNPFIPTPAKAG